MTKQKTVTALEVVEISTTTVVHTLTIRPGNDPERVMRGMLINMDRERFFVREVES